MVFLTFLQKTKRQTIFMIFFKKIKKLFFPRYRLHLDESCLEQVDFEKYRLKVYGGLGYVFADYDQILNTPNLICDIQPQGLFKIAVHNYERKKMAKKTFVKNSLRSMSREISHNGESKIYSTNDLMHDETLLYSLEKQEIVKIAYEHGYFSCLQDARQGGEDSLVKKKEIVYLNQS